MADLIITNFRLSFIWTETLTNALSEKSWTVSDYQFLASNNGYITRIDSISGHAEELSLSLPWKEKKNNRFLAIVFAGRCTAQCERKASLEVPGADTMGTQDAI